MNGKLIKSINSVIKKGIPATSTFKMQNPLPKNKTHKIKQENIIFVNKE